MIGDRGASSMIERVLQNGVMRVAVALTRPPEEGLSDEFYLDPRSGEPEGVVIDYMKLMAQDLGVTPEWVNIPWKDQVGALINDEVDILPKHTNTPDRALRVEFADQMIGFEVLLLTSRQNPNTLEALNQPDKVIACSQGSSNRAIIERYFPLARTMEIPEYLMGADALEAGTADGWVESAISKNLMKLRPDLDVMRDPQGNLLVLSRDYAHMAVRMGDQRSLNWINNWIKFRRAQGDLKHLLDVRWPDCLID